MSASPLKPLSSHSTSMPSQAAGDRNVVSSSASSSQTTGQPPSRADQVVYRFYLKTVAVLVEGRLTHYGTAAVRGGDAKKDKWFNLSLPEIDLHKSDLQIYRSITSYQHSPEDPNSCTIPPLLIAFILDTSDIPSGQALMWNRSGGRVRLDTNLGKGKGKEAESKSGIVLERWTFGASLPQTPSSGSQLAPHTAYRLGIIHFRALYSLVRLLPAYRLFRRLRRANNGLRLGIKLWGPEGYPNTDPGLEEAWQVMERGLIGLDSGLESLVVGDTDEEEEMERHNFPSLDLFGVQYDLGVEFRPEVDFHVEDMESVLSEKFVDMDEDWFKPTVARHRMESETSLPVSSEQTISRTNRVVSTSVGIPSNPSPIPVRQQAAPIGSFASGGELSLSNRQGGGRSTALTGTSQKSKSSLGTDKWGLLAQGLPFASGASGAGEGSVRDPPSPSTNSAPSGAAIAARRLSAHSIHPFRSSLGMSSSPSTSMLRGGTPIISSGSPTIRPPSSSSIGRTSSFLSQSGRSFTHAQMANMHLDTSPPVGNVSGRNPMSSSPTTKSPASPSSLSFTKQTFPRSLSGRPQQFTASANSSPFIPSSYERESPILASPGPQVIKRYSSSLSQRGTSSGTSVTIPPATSRSQGSSTEGRSIPGGSNLLQRTNTRESSLRKSTESGESRPSAPPPDEDDIQAFLKTLDSLPQPPSLAAQAAHSSRPNLPSTSSSLSTPSVPPSPANLTSSPASPGMNQRVPLTRAQVDDALRKMAGSFTLTSGKIGGVDSSSSNSQIQVRSRLPSESSSFQGGEASGGYGLLASSRPTSANRRLPSSGSDSPAQPSPPGLRRTPSGNSPSALHPRAASVKTGSPLAGSPMKPPPPPPAPPAPPITSRTLPSQPFSQGTARSLPLGQGLSNPLSSEDQSLPLPGALARGDGDGILSPQTTGGYSNSSNLESVRSGNGGTRRGPVLLRGGFGNQTSVRTTSGTSPSHSPIRDFARLTRDREREREKESSARGKIGDEEIVSSWNRHTSSGFATAGNGYRPSSRSNSSAGLPRITSPVSTDGGEGQNQQEALPGFGSLGAGSRRRYGQRTAPSSFGADSLQGVLESGTGLEEQSIRQRGRMERVVSASAASGQVQLQWKFGGNGGVNGVDDVLGDLEFEGA